MKKAKNLTVIFMAMLCVIFFSGCGTTTDTSDSSDSDDDSQTGDDTDSGTGDDTDDTTPSSPRIVAVGDATTSSSSIIYSDDNGATWTQVSETVYREDMNCVVYDSLSGNYYAGGDDGEILYSSDGTFWSSATGTGDSDDEFYGCASDGQGSLVIVGVSYYIWDAYYYGPVRYRNLSGSDYYNYLVHSDDELAGGSQNSGYLYGVAVDGNSRFVAVGDRILSNPTETISIARYSTNGGANWTEHNSNATIGIGPAVQLRDVAATQSSTFYAVGNGGTVYSTSDGGTNWTEEDTPATSSDTLYGIASDSNSAATAMIIVGSSGLILKGTKSGSAWSWSAVSSGTTAHLLDVATDGNEYWIAVGTGGKVIYSTDNGDTWTSGTSGISDELYGVAIGE